MVLEQRLDGRKAYTKAVSSHIDTVCQPVTLVLVVLVLVVVLVTEGKDSIIRSFVLCRIRSL